MVRRIPIAAHLCQTHAGFGPHTGSMVSLRAEALTIFRAARPTPVVYVQMAGYGGCLGSQGGVVCAERRPLTPPEGGWRGLQWE
jgi:hypothetical protein